MNMIHELWASITEISIATWLIYRELGSACAMPIALAVVNLFTTVFIAIPTGKAQATWIEALQERVTATAKTINCIKRLRISGLNDLVFSIVRNLRTEELAKSTKFRYLIGGSLILSTSFVDIMRSFHAFLGGKGCCVVQT
jgi:ATP-binding cassette, subfamily C (CFTR/MRP), member 1